MLHSSIESHWSMVVSGAVRFFGHCLKFSKPKLGSVHRCSFNSVQQEKPKREEGKQGECKTNKQRMQLCVVNGGGGWVALLATQ
jgi:hypothetical protein